MPETCRILLVEDNEADARLIRELLRDAGAFAAELVAVGSLEAATACLSASSFNVVLLDLSLPDANGVETVTRAQAIAPALPLVVLTGIDDEALATRAMREGAQDYLVKGKFEPALLVRTIRYAIERKRADESAWRLYREQAARAAAEAAERRARALDEASRKLSSTLDYDRTLDLVAEVFVREVAEHAIVDVVDETGGARRVVASAGGAEAPRARELAAHPASFGEDDPLGRVMRTGQQARVDPSALAATAPPSARVVWRSLCAEQALVVPLLARGNILGTVTLVGAAADLGAAEEALAAELAGRAALAIDNARLYRAREEVLAVVSHDLRNPLNVIAMAATMLSQYDALPHELRKKHLDMIRRSADRMTRLIHDLLELSRIEAGRLSLDRRSHEVAPLVREAIEMMLPLAREKQLVLEADAPDLALEIVADRERVLQVFSNLVGNAIKFTPPGGRIAIGVHASGNEVRFSVSDSGPGIPREHVEHIFDRFWQAKRTSRQGAGLGLAIVKGIVLAHGGRIWVESQPGVGSSFVFTVARDGAGALGEPDHRVRTSDADRELCH